MPYGMGPGAWPGMMAPEGGDETAPAQPEAPAESAN